MSSMNKVILVGNVGSVEVKEYKKGNDDRFLVQVSVATSDGYKGSDGEWKNETEWHRCIFAIPALAERAKGIQKGDQISVEGSIKTNRWTDKEGKEQSMKEISVVSYKTWKKAKSSDDSPSEQGGDSGQGLPSGGDDLPF